MRRRPARVRPLPRDRIDWAEFFVQFACPHGIRIQLTDIPAGTPEEVRIEKRLARIVKARFAVEAPYAFRRSTGSGPAVVDCVFAMAALADAVAREIGAATVDPPPGWATARELVADAQAIRRLWQKAAGAAPAAAPRRRNGAGALPGPDPSAPDPWFSPVRPDSESRMRGERPAGDRRLRN